MSDSHEQDYRGAAGVGATRFLPGTQIEIVREVRLEQPPRFAVFDFDGTLSLIREGWQDVMVPMLVEVLRETGTRETDEELTALVSRFVTELTGKQTIYQMLRLAEEVRARGGTPHEPVVYKHEYHVRLMRRIGSRREALRSGATAADGLLVPGSIELLAALRDRGVELFLASGTDETCVREESELLGLTPFFGGHIYGAVDDYRRFSKQLVIERILRENQVAGARLIGFGDGYVEIENTKAAGGSAVGVASDEAGRSGRADPWKRERLIGIGADIVVPDFQDYARLLEYLWAGC
ncbi:MAG TPA: HAD family hydrolase [Planctomycetaceae bacterium]|nr:HAD family hydrolase [Planctomycetaceae bacterium]